MTAYPLRMEKWSDLPDAIAHLQAAGAHHRAVPLSALYQGWISHFEIARNTPAQKVKAFIAAAKLPSFALIGDDDAIPTGPEPWRQANRLMRWAHCVVVHAAAGRVQEYEEFVAVTMMVKRLLVIETSSEFALKWSAAAMAARPDSSVRVILPEHGVHPVPMRRGEMQ